MGTDNQKPVTPGTAPTITKRVCSWWSALLEQKGETVGYKILLTIFDKLVIGAVLLGVGIYIQSLISEQTRRTELTTQMLTLHTELISEHRAALVSAIGEYLAVLGEAQRNIPKTEAALNATIDSLKSATDKTESAIQNLNAFFEGSSFATIARPLVREMGRGSAEFTGPAITFTEIEELSEKVRQESQKAFAALRDAVLQQAKHDAAQILAADTQ